MKGSSSPEDVSTSDTIVHYSQTTVSFLGQKTQRKTRIILCMQLRLGPCHHRLPSLSHSGHKEQCLDGDQDHADI